MSSLSEAAGLFKHSGVKRASPLHLALPVFSKGEFPSQNNEKGEPNVSSSSEGHSGFPRFEELLRKRALLERDRLIREAREALAREEAERRRSWEEEASRLRDEAHRKGYADGYAEGEVVARREAEAMLVDHLQNLERIQEELLAKYDTFRTELSREAEEAVFVLAEKIVREALQNEERFVRYVRAQLHERLEGEGAILFLAPEDFPILQRALTEEQTSDAILFRDRLELRIDTRLERGDFRLEVAHGVHEGSIQAQIARLHDAWERYQEVGGDTSQEG